ncbi:MAG TPA: hypothetical protein DDW33_14130 [Ktedonobacter sp.]|jgi:hypothetical protein|nr:hypothetical protein [Ktedonobacter sp.]HBE26810.1 hypothetical protein [Ktedonobacter sp.]HCF85842.1 hypothetical protein [Ktedonobacter sp.]HCP75751.1 hypothetical protein [Ktedonobacter sp.]
MFVRWKKRTSHAKKSWLREDHGATLSAYLVESIRIEGKPRQKVIAFIHSIREPELTSLTSRYYFWHKVMTEVMRHYPFNSFTDEQKAKIITGLAKVVPLLTDEEFQGEQARTRSVIGEWSMPVYQK